MAISVATERAAALLQYDEINTSIFENTFTVYDVPADGHCLIHAISKGLRALSTNSDVNIILEYLTQYVENNIAFFQEYLAFISVDDLRTQMRQYTLEKNYSTLFGESVAYLVALALNITLRIYER